MIALRCVVMIEKCRAPSIIRKAISRQLWSATARLTLQPSSFALATPAASILRLASSVSRWVATKSAMVSFPFCGLKPRALLPVARQLSAKFKEVGGGNPPPS